MDYILTNNGAVLMTQVAAGRTLLFTRTESGSGYSSYPAMLQSVIDKKQDMFLDEVTYENRQAVVKAVLSNMQLEEGYQLRQVGVYAKLEGDEADTLLVIGQQYSGEKIPPYQDGIIQIEYNIALKVSGTGNVTIEGVGTGYVTKGQFLAHLNDNTNPHNVTAKQVGLEKVQNVGTDDQTPTFEAAVERENITSGEKLSVIFGKIWKWFADLKGAAFCSVANNMETILPGSVLDARVGEKIKNQFTQLYSEIADGINLRWNPESNRIEVNYNGVWVNYPPDFVGDSVYIIQNGVCLVPFTNLDETLAIATQLDNIFTVLLKSVARGTYNILRFDKTINIGDNYEFCIEYRQSETTGTGNNYITAKYGMASISTTADSTFTTKVTDVTSMQGEVTFTYTNSTGSSGTRTIEIRNMYFHKTGEQ